MRRLPLLAALVLALLLTLSLASAASAEDAFQGVIDRKAKAYQTTPAVLPKSKTISRATTRRWLNVATEVGQKVYPKTCKAPTFTALYAFGDTAFAQAETGWTVPTRKGQKRVKRCEVAFNRDVFRRLSWGMFCKVVVHELGHLAGKHHTYGDEKSIMYYIETFRPVPACSRAMAKAKRAVKAKTSVRSSWGR